MGWFATQYELSYLGGIMDGEGSFSFPKRGPTNKNGYPAVTCGMTDIEAVKILHDKFGGTLRTIDRSRIKPTYKSIHLWQTSGRRALKVAMVLFPYLRLRRRQQAALDIMNHYINKPPDKRGPIYGELAG